MCNKLIATGIVCWLAAVAQADVDMNITHGGGNAPSGSRDEMNTNQDDAILLEINNDIAGRRIVVTDPASPLSTHTTMDVQTVGEILHGAAARQAGSTDSNAIYDRLNVRAVLRLLLFDDGELDDQRLLNACNVTLPQRTWAGPVDIGGGGGDIRPEPNAVPEPMTALLLGAAGAVACLRRRGRKTA